MRAMLLERVREPLILKNIPLPEPKKGEVRIKISACGVCRTDLHIYQGELKPPHLPLILGHQIVGTIDKIGPETEGQWHLNMRVGVPWLGKSCACCHFCKTGRENLCDHPAFTGFDLQGGYAEYCIASAEFIFPLPSIYNDHEAAPLLCAGLIGYRAFCMLEGRNKVGFYGFGASAHLLTQVAVVMGCEVFAFTRPNDKKAEKLALSVGAVWAGSSDIPPPCKLEGAIIFAPIGSLVPEALKHLEKGGMVVLAGIHMSDIPRFPYSLLWEERTIRSVANLTRKDGERFFSLATQLHLNVQTQNYPLEDASKALNHLAAGKVTGAAVLVI